MTGEVVEESFRLDAPAGDSTLVLSGRLPGSRFVPPLEGNAQALLVETHPLVRAELAGPLRRVSPSESGMETQFRGGRAFLLHGRETLEWKASLVEALRTGDVVVRKIEHGLYVSRDGSVLSEAQLAVANQGAAELPVSVSDPLYASVQEAPVLLMPEKDGIRVPLEAGTQSVAVQHRARVRTAAGLLAARLPLARTSVETGAQRVLLTLPGGWLPLAVRFGDDWSFALPGSGFLLWLALLVLLAERALAGCGVRGRVRWALAAVVALAAFTSGTAFSAVVVALVGVGAMRLAARLREGALTFRRAVALLAVVLGLLLFAAWRYERWEAVMSGSGVGGLGAIGGGILIPPFWLGARPPLMSDAVAAGAPRADGPAYLQSGYSSRAPQTSAPPQYRGLPVRREMPHGERGVVLEQPAAARPELHVLLVATGWLSALRIAILALAALLAFRWRLYLGPGFAAAFAEAREGLGRAFRAEH